MLSKINKKLQLRGIIIGISKNLSSTMHKLLISVIAIPTIFVTDEGSYSVLVTNSFRCTGEDEILVIVNPHLQLQFYFQML